MPAVAIWSSRFDLCNELHFSRDRRWFVVRVRPMRRIRVIALVAVLIAIAVIAWWKLRGNPGADSGSGSGGVAQGSAQTGSSATKRGPRVPLAKSTLAGRVVRPDSTAVAGATVALMPKLSIAGMLQQGASSPAEAEPARRAVRRGHERWRAGTRVRARVRSRRRQ
jgi:hypothetical protein